MGPAVLGGPAPLDGRMLCEVIDRELDELISALPPSIGGQRVVLAGHPAQALVDQGSRAADVMVFGSHGFGRFLRLISGSATSEVVRGAPWPVIVVSPRGRLPFAPGPGEAERAKGASPIGASRGHPPA